MAKWNSKFFYGHEISPYGLQQGRVDYRTLAKCGDMVLCNDITKLFYNDFGGEFIDPEQVNGIIDNSEQIDELRERIDALLIEYRNTDSTEREQEIDEQVDVLQEQIDELQDEQDNPPEIFQYYIISDSLAQILCELTDEIVYYIDFLGVYVWGITHWGTSWDYVLTNIEIDLQGGNE